MNEWIGYSLPRRAVYVDAAAARRFARAIGESNPVFFEEDTARAAGLAGVPVPPTYVFCLSFVEAPEVLPALDKLQRPLARALHGEQKFEYLAPVYVGDTITLDTSCTNVYEKKGGALEFFEWTTVARDGRGDVAARSTMTVIFRRSDAP